MLRSPTARATLAVGIVVTALVTAVIHVMLAVGEEATPTFQILFLLAAAGFVAGLAARFIGGDRIPWMRMLGQGLLILTAAAAIVAYVIQDGFEFENAQALISKLAEVILIVLVALDIAASRSASTDRPRTAAAEERRAA